MKDRILDAAEKRFFQYGLRKVTMDEIASDLGISKKTLYKYYAGKEEMARAVIGRFQDEIESILIGGKRDVSHPVERFEQMVIEVIKKRSLICNQFPADIKTDIPDLWENIEDFKKKQIMVHLVDILNEGMAKGVIRSEINTEIAARMYQSAIQNLICPEALGEGGFSVDEVFSTVSTIFLDGVRTKAIK